MPRIDATSSPTELNPPQLGDVGGESFGGETGGDVKVEVGEETNDPPPPPPTYESKSKRRLTGDPYSGSADPFPLGLC